MNIVKINKIISQNNNKINKIDYSIKIAIGGEKSVGKTALCLRYVKNKFLPIKSTIGVNFYVKYCDIHDCKIKLQLWDEFTHLILNGTNICVIMYDITNYSSFELIYKWINYTDTIKNKNIICALIGNKCEDMLERKVTYDEGKKIADKYNMLFLNVV